jgi:type IV secretory pathway TrbL component
MGKVNTVFRYKTAAQTSEPGYLRRKFAQIERRLAEERAEAEKQRAASEAGAKVRQIKKVAPL